MERVVDAPAPKGVHDDIKLVAGRHLAGPAIPLKDSLINAVDRLDKGHLAVETGPAHRLADGLAELGDDDLFLFGDGIET